MPKLKLINNGIARSHAQKEVPNPRSRLPITPTILRQIRSLWSPKKKEFDTIMLWAACFTAFFGFFRIGEITIPNDSSFNPARHLSPKDVSIDRRDNPTLIQIHLKTSKTDQEMKGMNIYVGKTTNDLCPVAALSAYLAIRDQSMGPFFHFNDNRALTKDRFTLNVRAALSTLGYTASSYAGHSFRIGAATTAAERGVEDGVIKTLGRWKSNAYQAYIKIPRSHLAQLSTTLGAPLKLINKPNLAPRSMITSCWGRRKVPFLWAFKFSPKHISRHG